MICSLETFCPAHNFNLRGWLCCDSHSEAAGDSPEIGSTSYSLVRSSRREKQSEIGLVMWYWYEWRNIQRALHTWAHFCNESIIPWIVFWYPLDSNASSHRTPFVEVKLFRAAMRSALATSQSQTWSIPCRQAYQRERENWSRCTGTPEWVPSR